MRTQEVTTQAAALHAAEFCHNEGWLKSDDGAAIRREDWRARVLNALQHKTPERKTFLGFSKSGQTVSATDCLLDLPVYGPVPTVSYKTLTSFPVRRRTYASQATRAAMEMFSAKNVFSVLHRTEHVNLPALRLLHKYNAKKKCWKRIHKYYSRKYDGTQPSGLLPLVDELFFTRDIRSPHVLEGLRLGSNQRFVLRHANQSDLESLVDMRYDLATALSYTTTRDAVAEVVEILIGRQFMPNCRLFVVQDCEDGSIVGTMRTKLHFNIESNLFEQEHRDLYLKPKVRGNDLPFWTIHGAIKFGTELLHPDTDELLATAMISDSEHLDKLKKRLEWHTSHTNIFEGKV